MNTAPQSPPRMLWLILGVALLLRIGVAIYLGNDVSGFSGAHDEITYSALGQRFADGHGMTFAIDWYPWIKANTPQSYFSYVYSAFLAGVYSLFGFVPLVARLLHALMGTAIVYLIWELGERFFGRKTALLAAAIAAVYAYFIFYSVALITETPFILATLLALRCAMRVRESERLLHWVTLGIALAAALLLRVSILFFIPFLLLWTLWQLPRRHYVRVLIPVAILALSVLPFVVRNYQLWDTFMLLGSQSGHVFWNGNHPGHNGDFHPFVVFEIPADVLALENEAEMTSALMELGINNVKADPLHFVQLTATRLRELFTFWPTADSSLLANTLRVASAGVIAPFTVLGLALALRSWRRYLLIFLFMALHAGVHAVTWSMIRYRMPLDVFFIMFTAHALIWLREYVSSKQLTVNHDDPLATSN